MVRAPLFRIDQTVTGTSAGLNMGKGIAVKSARLGVIDINFILTLNDLFTI